MTTLAEALPLELGFPSRLRPAWLSFAGQRLDGEPLRCRAGQAVTVDGDTFVMPQRIHLDRRKLVNAMGDTDLPPRDRQLVLALGSRHHDGYFRESCVRKLIGAPDARLLPYLLAPLGDYVLEIGDVVVDSWAPLDAAALAVFARDNPAFIARIRRRATSYWNCYYRARFPHRADYPPWQALSRLPT